VLVETLNTANSGLLVDTKSTRFVQLSTSLIVFISATFCPESYTNVPDIALTCTQYTLLSDTDIEYCI